MKTLEPHPGIEDGTFVLVLLLVLPPASVLPRTLMYMDYGRDTTRHYATSHKPNLNNHAQYLVCIYIYIHTHLQLTPI